jgi:hypothetical protein
MRDRLGLWGFSCALLASACSLEDVDSDAIRTQGMFADMLALAPGDGDTLVRVHLTVGGEGGTNVTLVGDDALQARAGEVTQDLVRSGKGRYERKLGGDAAGEVTIELARGPDDAPASGIAVLPEPFILSLTTDASAGVDRSAAVSVSWSPASAGGSMRWTVEGRCLWTESGVAPDVGALTLGPERFRVRATRAGEDCEVQLSLDRENVGSVDRVWIPGSRFRAIQRRGVTFVSTPASIEVDPEPEEPEAASN